MDFDLFKKWKKENPGKIYPAKYVKAAAVEGIDALLEQISAELKNSRTGNISNSEAISDPKNQSS